MNHHVDYRYCNRHKPTFWWAFYSVDGTAHDVFEPIEDES